MKKFLYLLLVTLIFPSLSSGTPIYKQTGADGKTTYSSKPQKSGDQPAKLPEIVRGEVKTALPGMQSCKTHGGINCDAGTDSDGSVICTDGFKDAVTRFKFSCTTPRLEISEISDTDASGSFKVYIRNVSSIEAKSIAVEYRPEIGGKYKLVGTDRIGGYESGEYVYKPLDELHKMPPPDPAKIRVECANCL